MGSCLTEVYSFVDEGKHSEKSGDSTKDGL